MTEGINGNRINEKGAVKLINEITKNGKIIDLNNNNIGKLGCEHLSISLRSKDCWLEELSLEDNRLSDISGNLIINSIINNNTLRKLNLSKNYLTNNIGDSLY